jgi:hypothetical protein
MTDLPLNKKSKKVNEVQPSVKSEVPVIQSQNPTKVEVTHENADLIAVHFLSQIFARLGYIIKLLEEKK